MIKEKIRSLAKNKRGMTMIEIIVVLVILAILAAFMIPSMLGFVDDARGKAFVAEARTCYIAAQTIATEEAAFGKTDADIASMVKVDNTRFKNLIGPEVATGLTSVTATVSSGAVSSLEFVKDGTTVTITPGAAAVISK